ncbi:hypothetical protein [Nocardiopsis alborubida]|uniref:Uncharacterized protein n=1 Tax=Nocardiopsis alborubida TaxID=146802 RepID=A0A7X6MEK0_9ACTN|nr:hypothetical protein [Nocardiopsis alborubida]NKZ00084.1 hypothetical protein [Nocardiopsis alborubida]
MRETRLLGEDWHGARLQLVRDTLLVVVDDESELGLLNDGFLAAAFDLRSRRPLGPALSFASPIHLVDLPALGPEPVLAFTTSKDLVIADVRDGSVLETFPLPGTRTGEQVYDMCYLALGHYGGRDLLFLHEGGYGTYDHWVSAMDLATGEPVPAMTYEHYRYREVSERLTLRHGYLAWPSTEEVVEFGAEDFSVFDKCFVYVQRADDGAWVGKVGLYSGVPEDRDVEIAHAAGRTYLAEAGNIVTLPDLEPVFPEDPWVLVSRVTEWGGRPVAVLIQRRRYLQEPSGQLCHLFLDTDAPEKAVIPWSVPPQVHDLLATPDGTIVVSSAEGVHVLDVDPVP